LHIFSAKRIHAVQVTFGRLLPKVTSGLFYLGQVISSGYLAGLLGRDSRPVKRFDPDDAGHVRIAHPELYLLA